MATEHEIDTAAKRKPFRSCIVPMCTNTSIKTPEKLFVPVPKGENIRKQWVKMIRRDGEFSPQSGLYCCEDHFDVSILETIYLIHIKNLYKHIELKNNKSWRGFVLGWIAAV